MSLYDKDAMSLPDPANSAPKAAAVVEHLHLGQHVPEGDYAGDGHDRMVQDVIAPANQPKPKKISKRRRKS